MAKNILAKKFKNLNVLIHFYEENRFSILKLKDCLPQDNEQFANETFDIATWERSQKVEVS